MFGSSNNKSLFGSSTTNSAFGQPNTSAFGVQPTQNTGPFGGMAGQQPQQSIFGSTPTQPLFGGAQPSLFGSTPSAANTNTFGAQSTASAFGGTSSSIFGGNQQNNSLFGANRFGTNTNASPFGSTAIGSAVAATNGTTIKFNPTAGTDTMMKNGVSQNINTRHQCITCMREYESKSLEELRLEDYTANRKGPQQNTGMFSNTNAVSSNSLFGTTATPQNAFSSNNSGGLFGQNKPNFGTLAATPTPTSNAGLFGSFGQNKPLFGSTTSFPSTQAPGPTTSMFGPVSTSNPTLNNSFFTGTTNTTATVKPLFGNNPTAQPQQPLFGQTNAQNSSLAQKPLFGNTTNTVPQFGANTTTLFNSGNTSNLFSSSQPSLFNTGTTSTNNSLAKPLFFNNPTSMPLNSSISGANISSTPSLFGNPSSAFGNTGSMFGQSAPNFNFGSTNPSFQSSNTFQQNAGPQPISGPNPGVNTEQLVTRFQTFPYGDSPQLQIDLTIPSNSKIRTKFTTDPKTLNQYRISAKTIDSRPQRFVNNSPKVNTMLFDGLEDDNSSENKTAKDIFVARRNVKKLVFKPKMTSTMSDLNVSQNSPNNSSSFLVSTQPNPSIKFDDSIASNITVNEFMRKDITFNKQIDLNTRRLTISPNKVENESISGPDTTNRGSLNESECFSLVNKCGVILTRTDYYTIPPLEELDNYYDISTDTCVVPNFTVGRHDYGSIYWSGPIDLKGLNLDEIVHIRRKEVIVYPDEDIAPPVGESLNRSAQITLDQVWPIDKSTHELIKDKDRLRAMKYPEKIEAATNKLGANFKEYRPDSGSWVFTVKHFSKYGLTDEDDDDDEEVMQSDNSIQTIPTQSVDNKTVVDNKKKLLSKGLEIENEFESVLNNDINSEDIFTKNFKTKDNSIKHLFEEEDEDEEEMYDNDINRSFEISTQLSTKYNDFDKIRSTLFDEYEDIVSKKSKTYPIISQKEMKGKVFSPILPNISRPIVSKKRELTFEADIFSAENKLICDISSVCLSNSPKLKFFNGSRNFVFTKGTTVLICEFNLIDLNPSAIDRFDQQLKKNSNIFKPSDQKTIPLIETQEFAKNSYNRLSLDLLVEALYGPLTEVTQYAAHQQRIDRILEWLFSANKKLSIPKNSYSKIMHFLSTNELEFAVEEALQHNNPRLASLLALGNSMNKQLIISQLDSWKRSKADAFIEYDLMTIYVLMSGLMEWKLSNDSIVRVLENIEWTQQLALILLYKTPPEVDTNELGLNMLSTSISSMTIIPEAVEYHLLASHNPWAAICQEPLALDAWFLHQSLKAFHVMHDDNQYSSDCIHSFVASQLPDIRWACFVATHIKNDDIRKNVVSEIITRNGRRFKQDFESMEWLSNEIFIPSVYLSEALAIESKAIFDYKSFAYNLIECKQWSEAHDILIEWVWPQMIINGENDSIGQLIDKLKPNSHLISNWYSNGAHIYDTYLKCIQRSNIEDIKSFNIHQMRCNTIKHVLCQSEMARKVNILYSELSGGKFVYNTPIPEDYALIELKTNAKNLIKSFC